MRRTSIATGVVVALGASTFIWAGSADASFPGVNGQIVYDSYSSLTDCDGPDCARGPLYLFNPESGKTRRFADACGGPLICTDSFPAFAPDGRTLAFTRYRGGNSTVAFADASGREVDGLSANGASATFAPNGRSLLVARQVEARRGAETGTDLFVTSPTGVVTRRLTWRGGERPKWSVRGEVVFERRTRSRPPQLYVVSSRGGPARQLTRNGGRSADWSPSGRLLTFERKGQVVTYDVARKQLRRLTSRGGRAPVWSPDGKAIAYLRGKRLIVLRLGAKPRGRTYRPAGPNVQTLDWQPLPRR